MYTPYQMNRSNDDLKVVNGRASAEQYMMYPNSRVILLDSTQDRFYLKETDAAGMPRIKTYDFKEVFDTSQSEYITKDELKELMDQYELNIKQSLLKQQQQQSDAASQF